jgi:riboflavin biosynthesis pyrimidine reductase
MASPFHVAACLASSVDGKITAAPDPLAHPAATETWVKLGSEADLNRLFALRDEADVLVYGASTLRAWPAVRFGLKALQQPQGQWVPPAQVWLTRSWALPPAVLAAFGAWQPHWPTLWGASATPPPLAVQQALPQLRWLPLPVEGEPPMRVLMQRLQAEGYQRVLVEGGGDVVAQCLAAQVLETLHLTLTPWLLGGDAPSLVGRLAEGAGLPRPWPKVLWQHPVQAVGAELFLTGTVQYT